MAFRVGQKVVCINDSFVSPGWEYVGSLPRRGAIYTVRAVYIQNFPGFGPFPCLLLEELRNPAVAWRIGTYEHGFGVDRFRPLVERKTELPACITALLDPKNHPPVPVEKEKAMSPGDQD